VWNKEMSYKKIFIYSMDQYNTMQQDLDNYKRSQNEKNSLPFNMMEYNPYRPRVSPLTPNQIAQDYFLGNPNERKEAEKVAQSRVKYGFRGGKRRTRRFRKRK
jgi:hypothetical protein